MPDRFRSAKDVHRPRLPEGPCATEATARVHVNHGRLLVACPWCPSVEYAWVDDRRFICSACLNRAVGGHPIAVEWPEDFDQIEAVLLQRANPLERNWEPGEPVNKLETENTIAAHGGDPNQLEYS